MKRINMFFPIALTLMLITACGSSTPTATEEPAQPVMKEVPAKPTATNVTDQPTATEAPIASGTMVTITLADNTIQSSLTEFKTSVPYTFVITNTGRRPHSLAISTPVAIAGSIAAAQSAALLDINKNQLPPGTNLTVDFTFPESAADTKLEFACLIPMHYTDGMLLPITVTK